MRSKPRPERLAPPLGRVREAAALTPPPSFLRCARSLPLAPALSLVRRRDPYRPASTAALGRGVLQAEPRAVAPRGDSMGALQPALGLLLLLLCPAQVSGFQRPGRAGRDAAGALRQLRRPPAGELRAWGSWSSGAALEVAFSSYVCPPSRCPVLWERVTAGASIWLALSYSSGGHLI